MPSLPKLGPPLRRLKIEPNQLHLGVSWSILLVTMAGCERPQVRRSVITSNVTSPTLDHFLLMSSTSPGRVRGDADSAETDEHLLRGPTVKSVENPKLSMFAVNGWKPLTKNNDKWKTAPPDPTRAILGFQKGNMYYVMFIRLRTDRAVCVTHILSTSLSAMNSGGYFMPAHNGSSNRVVP